MKPRDLPGAVRDLVLRTLPHRAPTGLVPIGEPGPDAPVLVTGNFTLTVRRLRDALAGRDAWLLCANSNGINVWCAAGGGHLTHHDVISAVRTTHLADHVHHRELILPQLAATGVERRAITEATGWATRWGPARLEDLPAFLDRGSKVHNRDRQMRFPLWERAEMAAMWAAPLLLICSPLAAWLFGSATAAAGALGAALYVFGLFVLLPWIRVTGHARWLTFAAFAAASHGVGAALLLALGAATPAHLAGAGGVVALAAGILAVDLAGTTPWYGSYINTWRNPATVELLEERCTGAADCVQVCPRDVLQMDGHRRKVEIARPDQCIQCGACIVQCPEDALRFRYADGRIVEPATIRRTRMNMLGRRTVAVSDRGRRGAPPPSARG